MATFVTMDGKKIRGDREHKLLFKETMERILERDNNPFEKSQLKDMTLIELHAVHKALKLAKPGKEEDDEEDDGDQSDFIPTISGGDGMMTNGDYMETGDSLWDRAWSEDKASKEDRSKLAKKNEGKDDDEDADDLYQMPEISWE